MVTRLCRSDKDSTAEGITSSAMMWSGYIARVDARRRDLGRVRWEGARAPLTETNVAVLESSGV
jgi:hypothetical protein